ncbi:MAG: hypothetical protein AAFQ22_15535 [Pseudomonadota bacterium]
MTILAINTAQSACDVAVLRSGETVAHHCETLKTGQDARLPALVERLPRMDFEAACEIL